MSLRYTGAWLQDGAFNPLTAPTPTILYNLLGWGTNSNGEIGLGNTTSYSSPKQVGSTTDWEKIAIGGSSSFSIKTNGTLWSWGVNSSGQLGLGNRTNYSSPKQVGSLTNWSNISAGGAYCVAVKTDGTLWSWGVNNNGQLGLGNITYYSSPKQVGSLTNWLKISCGNSHTIAIKTDGTMWAWGQNNSPYGNPYGGQLGVGNLINYSSPKQVGALTNWLFSAAGGYHTIATKTDGTLWSWGMNSEGPFGANGCLGLNNATSYNSPKQVGSLTNWYQPGAGARNSFCVKINGTIWSWGEGYLGSLGLGNSTYYSSPKQIGGLTNWSFVNTQVSRSTSAIKTDGTLWMWGDNGSGQLGLGNTSTRFSPVQVGTSTTWKAVAVRSSTLALG